MASMRPPPPKTPRPSQTTQGSHGDPPKTSILMPPPSRPNQANKNNLEESPISSAKSRELEISGSIRNDGSGKTDKEEETNEGVVKKGDELKENTIDKDQQIPEKDNRNGVRKETTAHSSDSSVQTNVGSSIDNNRPLDTVTIPKITPLPSGPHSEKNGAVDIPVSSTTERDRKKTCPEEGAVPKSGGPPYVVPPWSSPPGVPYKLEVLKEGKILDSLDVSVKGAYMFGRSDRCDFVLEHPTISRYHAVFQFRSTGEAFVYDLGSTHGTSINKRQIKGQVYAPLHVGDLLKFGQSSRLYIVQGPSELMIEEGLSRAERRALRGAEACKKRREEEEAEARAAHSQQGRDEITWGMGEDAETEEGGAVEEEVSYETYKGKLTENQEKLMEKLIKKQEKLSNLQSEIDAIQSKEIGQGGLSQGQQTQIARNEQRMEQLLEEVESFEESLNESIKESLGAKKGSSSGKKTTGRGYISEEDAGDSDEDEFYNRARKKKILKTDQKVETAETLLEKRHFLNLEREELQLQIKEEEKRKVKEEEKRKVKEEEKRKGDGNEKKYEEGTRIGKSLQGGEEEGEGEGEGEELFADPLDAFMSNVTSEIEKGKSSYLERERKRLETEISKVEKLLQIADPGKDAEKKWKPENISLSQKRDREEREESERVANQKKKNRIALALDLREREVKGGKETLKDLGKENMTDRGGESERVDVDAGVGSGVKGEEGVMKVDDSFEEKGSENSMDRKEIRNFGKDEDDLREVKTEHGNLLVDKIDSIMGENGRGGVKMEEEGEVRHLGDLKNEKLRNDVKENDETEKVEKEKVEKDNNEKERSEKERNEKKKMEEKKREEKKREKKRRKLGPFRPPQIINEGEIGEVETWLPPEGQIGDGRTSLNAKFGY